MNRSIRTSDIFYWDTSYVTSATCNLYHDIVGSTYRFRVHNMLFLADLVAVDPLWQLPKGGSRKIVHQTLEHLLPRNVLFAWISLIALIIESRQIVDSDLTLFILFSSG